MARLTAAELANMMPGVCTTPGCGRHAETRNSAGRCLSCHNAQARAAHAARQAQLASMPRCEVPACSLRATWHTCGVELCGRHLARFERAHNRNAASGIGLFTHVSYTRATVLAMAEDK